ncbi:hypothetical protein POTOM_033676 [Populus tomentosa]|uniref:SHSP domain-containing protein n=1 Tax=Populus tomentosa TaxID=118781 RepID=A0A8X7Z6P4_POPTO|nr:hypothetical protein POTOM_033676 [Populus tomentosa]
MESKPRGTGAVAAGRVLQEFEPKMEWDRELGVDTLRVFLPGFKKEQIKVQVSSSRVLRISGERQLSDNRWSCFLEKIPLSSNHNQKEISASYDKGILYVKHPKLIVQDDAELQENEQPPVESSTLDGKPPQEKALQPTKMDKDKAAKGLVSGAQKLNMESYSKDFSGLVVDMTKPRKLLNLVLFILSVVVLSALAKWPCSLVPRKASQTEGAASAISISLSSGNERILKIPTNRKDKMSTTEAMAGQLNDQAYEDYNPTLEWVRDAGFDTLLVYIPGFKKQQLKVQVTSTRTLRITGERSHGDNKWSSFHKELPIPLYYDVNQISANFKGGILQVKHPKKITSPANPVQETAEPQKPNNEKTQDQNSGQEQFDQEVPPKTETDEPTSGKINGVENATVAEANNIHVPPKTSEDQKSDLGLAEPEKNTSTGDEKHEDDGYSVQNAAKMQQEEETAVVSGISKANLALHKQGFGGLVAEMKKPRISTHFVVATGLLILVLGIYVQNAIRSSGEAEN